MIHKKISAQTQIDTKSCCVLFFLRLPERGRVKTRLAAGLSKDHAFALYKCFILDELATLKQVKSRIYIYYTPDEALHSLSSWLGNDLMYCAQKGEDLGARMRTAFEQAFARGYERVLLVGSDIPDLPVAVLEEGFFALADHDACLAPALDGGYYCIGFNRGGYCPAVFQNMVWSTPRVCSQTSEIITEAGHSLVMLSSFSDVDTTEDLGALCQRIGPDDASFTALYLKKSGLWKELTGKE